MYPGLQLHNGPSGDSVQVPAFLQTWELQLGSLSEQNFPTKFGGQIHWNPSIYKNQKPKIRKLICRSITYTVHTQKPFSY